MTRWLRLLLLFTLSVWAVWTQEKQDKDKQPSQEKHASQDKQASQEPPEEDETLQPKVYAFNPIQAEKELNIGNFYFKKTNYKAAAARFETALKWNANYAEACLRLGETREKMDDPKGAREAFARYLKLEPEGKRAKEIRDKLAAIDKVASK